MIPALDVDAAADDRHVEGGLEALRLAEAARHLDSTPLEAVQRVPFSTTASSGRGRAAPRGWRGASGSIADENAIIEKFSTSMKPTQVTSSVTAALPAATESIVPAAIIRSTARPSIDRHPE